MKFHAAWYLLLVIWVGAAVSPLRAVTISFLPVSQTVTLGDAAQVDLVVLGLTSGSSPSLGAFDLTAAFDQTILQASGASFGIFLGDPSLFEALTSTDLSDPSAVRVFETSLLTPSDLATTQDPVKSAGFTIVTLQFNTLSVGRSPLSFSSTLLGDEFGSPLDGSFGAGSITVIAPIPEPASFVLTLIALALLIFRRRTAAGLLALCCGTFALRAQTDTVVDYATRCYERLGITGKVPDKFQCKAGTQLFTAVAGVIQDINIGGLANATAAAAPPGTCDRPPWLGASPQLCYGNSYLSPLTIGDVTGALLCRHKTRWSDKDDDYDDVAMILHNNTNGETCWLQSPQGSAQKLKGIDVPAPHTAAATAFWLKPSAAAAINCFQCHDNGPFMNSRWLNDNIRVLKDPKKANEFKNENPLQDGREPFINSGIKFEDWPKVKFVTIGGAGLKRPGEKCTQCHKMAQKLQSCSVWIDRSVGRNFHAKANATGQAFDIAFWMADEHPFTTVADWNNVYKAHVDKLKACCTAGPGGAECKEQAPKIRTAALPSLNPGATIAASIDGGATYPYLAASPTDGPPVLIGSGTSLMLRWESEPSLSTCAIEATFPVGVIASSGSGPVSTGTNWNLDDSPQTVGPLSSPGLYNFDINCNHQVHAALTFQISGSPAPMIQIQAFVNNTAGPLATAPGGTASTEVSAQLLDTINLAWSADNIQPGSCKVTEIFDPPGSPTGRTFVADSGFQELPVQASTAQTYSLACKGADGTTDITAQTTVRLPGLGLLCDINRDGKVDQSDINLIFNATGPAKQYSDPRDVDHDGMITVNDARFCATKCTKAGCVP